MTVNSRVRIEPVVRIVLSGWRSSLLKTIPVYVKAVVDYRYFVDGRGPLNILGQPYTELPEDDDEAVRLWRKSGCQYTRGAKS